MQSQQVEINIWVKRLMWGLNILGFGGILVLYAIDFFAPNNLHQKNLLKYTQHSLDGLIAVIEGATMEMDASIDEMVRLGGLEYAEDSPEMKAQQAIFNEALSRVNSANEELRLRATGEERQGNASKIRIFQNQKTVFRVRAWAIICAILGVQIWLWMPKPKPLFI
jgi:hypothetical protein